MGDKDIQINLSLKEINEVLCSGCKEKLLLLTQGKIAGELAKRTLEG